MVNQGLLEIAYEEKQALKLTELSKPVLFEGKKVEMINSLTQKELQEARQKAAKPKTQKQQYNEALFETLRELRKQIATQQGMAPYLVFHDAALQEMAATRPVTEFDFKNISGVSDRKFQLFGHQFINKILEFVQQKEAAGKKAQGATYLVTLSYWKHGLSIDEIANKRGLSPSTIGGHFIKLKEEGHEVDFNQFLSENEKDRIRKSMAKLGKVEGLKSIFIDLKQEVEYFKIRMFMELEGIENLTTHTP